MMLVFAAASCIIIVSSSIERQEQIEAVKNEASVLVQSLAAQQEQVVIGIRQTLGTISLLPVVKTLDIDICNKIFRELIDINPSYTNINAVTPDGNMFSASAPFVNVNLSDRKHFKDAAKTLDLSPGEYIIGRVGNSKSLNYTFPVLDSGKTPVAFITVGFNLDAFSSFLKKVKLPEGFSFDILDHAGVRLYRTPEHASSLAGKPIPKAAFEKVSSDIDHGTFEINAEDGINRIYAFKQLRLRDNAAPYMYMLIGVPKDHIIQTVNSKLFMNLSLLGIAAVISFLLTLVLGHPIARLAAAAKRLGGDDLGVRTSLPHTSDDLGQLAKSFDDMASMLEMRSLESRNAEKALWESESKYRNLVETTGTGYLIMDQEGKVLDANYEYAKLSGHNSVEEMLGRNVVEWTAPYDLERHAEELKRCVAEGLTRNLEIDYADRQGSIIPVEINATLIRTAEGTVVICLIRNITERRRAEAELQRAHDEMEITVVRRTAELSEANDQLRSEIETRKKVENALRESEQRFRSLFERHRATMLLIDPDSGAILDVNEAAVEFYGFSKVELFSMNIAEINQLSAAEIAEARQNILKGEMNRLVFPHRLHSGEIRTVEVYSSPIEVGGRTALFSIVHDITERKRAEDELAQMTKYLKNVFESSPDGISIVDAHGKFIEWNRMLGEQIGYTFEELKDKSAFDLYADKDRLSSMLTELRREGTVKKYEIDMKRKDGTIATVEISISLLRDDSNMVIGSVSVVRDLSDMKKALYALQTSHEQLHQEITVRQQAEAALRLRLSLLEFAATHSLEELLQKTVDEVGSLTNSPIGFFHFVESDGKTLALRAGSTQTTEKFSKAEGKGLNYDIDQAGVWAECVNVRRPVIHNDYAALSHRQGLPEGHSPFIRELVVPIVRSGRIVAILGIGNKPADYDDKDVEVVSYLADVAWEITERKRAEEALRESESKFRSYIEHAPLAVFVADREGRILDVNPSATDLLGYEAYTLSGMNIMDLHSEADQEEVICDFNILLEKGHVETEHRMKKRDGSLTWVSLNAVMTTDQLSFAYCQDITERKLAREALRESEERYRSVIENMQDVFYRTDKSGAVVMLSPSGAGLLGYDALDEMCGKPVESFWMYPEEREKMLRALRKDGVVRDCEATFKKKDGSPLYVAITSAFRKDDHGNILGVEGVIRDITERKRAEEERIRLVTAIEQVAEAIIISDSKSIVDYVNPAFTAMSGYEGAEVIGRHSGIIKSDKHDRAFYRHMRETLAGGEVWSGRLTNKRKDGSLYETETTISPVRNMSGAVIYYVSIHRDITRQVKLESELRQAQKMESLGALAGGIAHDFNNILGVIMGFTELAKFELGNGSPVLRKLDEVLKASDRAKELVKQILAFSRRTDQQKIPLQLGLIVKEALRILRPGLPSTIEIKTEVLSKAAVLADPTQMHQVLMNLCTNAAHAMQEQGGVLEVRLTDVLLEGASTPYSEGLKQGLYVELTVKDTGCGIDPDVLNSIFDPFFTTKKQGEGTGLGLSVVHGIVKSYEGQINVESEPGTGARFTVLIPALKSECAPIKAEDQALLPLGRERILVVDDEPQLAEAVEQMLKCLGYDVIIRSSGTEALDVLRHQPLETPFDLVITDMTMPHLTGADLADELRGFQPAIPVILMTGFSKNMDAEKVKYLGIQGFLMKPVTLEQLAKTVREVLDLKRETGSRGRRIP